jgi:hypothetical protein
VTPGHRSNLEGEVKERKSRVVWNHPKWEYGRHETEFIELPCFSDDLLTDGVTLRKIADTLKSM